METGNTEFVCPTCGADVVRTEVTCPKCGNPLEWEGVEGTPAGQPGPIPQAADVRPMGLGDIFDRTFRMLAAVFTRSVLILVLLFIPASLLLMAGAGHFYGTLGELLPSMASGETPGTDEAMTILSAGLVFALAFVLAYLGAVIGEIAVTILVSGEFSGTRLSWKDALARAAGFRMLKGVGIMLLQGLVYAAIIVIPALLFGVAGGGAGGIVLGILASLVAVIYLLIRWTFSLTAVGAEDLGVGTSMRRSWILVQNGWWRVLGILLLMGLLIGFAIMLVTTPISMIAFWDFYREYFRAIATGGTSAPDPAAMAKAMASMGPGLGLSMGLNLMLTTLTKPVYTTVLYFDLRARRGEFVRGA